MLKRLEYEFYESDARHAAPGDAEMAEMAASQFRDRHPELSEEAINAFAWCYTYDYK